jgi:ADP-ribose pyrophosphatase YjhB (NUDIX family)
MYAEAMAPIRQGGAITVRDTSKGTEVLLVRAKKDPRQWIFPKGHQEDGETLAETAVRELKEEGGVVGESIKSVGVSTFRSGGEDVEVTYFLVRDTGKRAKAERDVAWRSFSDAKELVSFDDGRRLLERAKEILRDKKK